MVLAMLASTPALAQPWDCVLSAECPAGDACATVERAVALLPADHAGDLFLSGLGADMPIARLSPEGAAPTHFAGALPRGRAAFITIAADTRALVTLHDSAATPAAISYFGTCEELT
jgi:hypothetical protein